MIDEHLYPCTNKIVSAITRQWPEHGAFLQKSFARREADLLRSTERNAAIVLKIVGHRASEIAEYAGDYRFLCEILMEEETAFRRTGHYRLQSFQDALAQVYSNSVFMNRYMNFLLLSHIAWDNHARAMASFADNYLPSVPVGTHHLEIGPGHGLLLHLANATSAISSVTGWDVSPTSIEQTKACLDAMGESRPVDLTLQDLFEATQGNDGSRRFGSVVLAEVLEHLEDPVSALRAVAKHMSPGGHLWIHVPINSPAPDHLYLLRSEDEALALVRAGGFEPIHHVFFPMSGQTIERARRLHLTISAVITARLPV